MSSDFYFKKWKKTISNLATLVNLDIGYQVAKAHDQTECQAVIRLSGVLGRYIDVYNDTLECLHSNLQVQKTRYLKEIAKAIVTRILEIKNEIQKLEASSLHFFGNGLVDNKLTTNDIVINDIPERMNRLNDIQSAVEKALQRAKEKKDALANPEIKEEFPQYVHNWWDDAELDDEEEKEEDLKTEEVPEEVRKTRDTVAFIQAHEKSRQRIRSLYHEKQKRDIWEKKLSGSLQPRASFELRERGAKIIQKVFRAYFESKRERIAQRKRDEKLGINFCQTPTKEVKSNNEELMLEKRSKRHDVYQAEWKERREKIKEQYLNRKREAMIEDYRDQIRDWFHDWFERVQFIHDIPKDGSVAIFRGDIPEPDEWLEEYNKSLIEKQANTNKSAQQKKFEKMEANRKLMMLKREEKMKKKVEEALLKKMKKNPTLHPGYHYPQSRRTEHILQVIEEYHSTWDRYDEEETLVVKEKYVNQIVVDDSLMEAKLEVLPTVDEQMGNELHTLKLALKEDYMRHEMKIPEQMTKRKGRKKKKKNKDKELFNQNIVEKIEELAVKGFIKDYPKTNIEDYIGDPNFAGEDLRCNLGAAFPFHSEVKAFWWERCREVIHGFHKILIVGPKGGGKTKLVHALASINNATLFELDPIDVQGGFLSAAYLQQLVQEVVFCARTVQPSVIHIKHVEKLFYLRVPPEEAEMSLDLIKNFFVQKLFRRIKKPDKITVIGTCVDPWVTKSKPMVKWFPTILLLPNTNYSLVFQVVKTWVTNYNVIPSDFNVSNLAYVLQGYSFGYLKEILAKFMSADRIVQIAAFTLSPMEVYNYILEDNSETKTEYEKYLKWYMEKTNAGKAEAKHLADQKEFKLAVQKYVEKTKKAKKLALSTSKSTTV